MGAWIETDWSQRLFVHLVSHPSWVRGLKPGDEFNINLQHFVAPLVGAWIETTEGTYEVYLDGSHPSWVRGLKLESV